MRLQPAQQACFFFKCVEVVLMVCFFQNLLKQKLPHGYLKRVGGGGYFGKNSKVSSFFSGWLP